METPWSHVGKNRGEKGVGNNRRLLQECDACFSKQNLRGPTVRASLQRCQQGQGQEKQSGRDLALCAVVGVAAVLTATGVGTKNAGLEALAVALEALGPRAAAA